MRMSRETDTGDDWPSGRVELRAARAQGKWPDGKPVGRGFPQPYLQAQYANAVTDGLKTVEGRPGGGWVSGVAGRGIKADDYIHFKNTLST